ncbi:MAG: Tol biopolymer transporter periplasmic protein [Calothrix sp. MO_192.B10]|nr:Tol biopolymer transporter periplasmic protein [Calothrix sp. MO_192.B10]
MLKKFLLILIFASLGLINGCVGYPRLLNSAFDPGGRSLNSPAAERNPHIAGRYVVFTSDRRGSQDIYLFDRLRRSLIDLPGLNSLDAIADHPTISEDGNYIVFATYRQGRSAIFLYDRQTRQSRNLTLNLQAEVRNPTISADGSRIAFESSVNGQWDILVYDRFGRPLNIQ